LKYSNRNIVKNARTLRKTQKKATTTQMRLCIQIVLLGIFTLLLLAIGLGAVMAQHESAHAKTCEYLGGHPTTTYQFQWNGVEGKTACALPADAANQMILIDGIIEATSYPLFAIWPFMALLSLIPNGMLLLLINKIESTEVITPCQKKKKKQRRP
jgi:hypothetical protein